MNLKKVVMAWLLFAMNIAYGGAELLSGMNSFGMGDPVLSGTAARTLPFQFKSHGLPVQPGFDQAIPPSSYLKPLSFKLLEPLHEASEEDYQKLVKMEDRLTHIIVVYSFEGATPDQMKMVEIPILQAAGGRGSSGGGGTTTGTSDSAGTTGGGGYTGGGGTPATRSDGNGQGGTAPPPPPPPGGNGRRPTESIVYRYDHNIGWFTWIVAIFNYWWMTSTAQTIANHLADLVPVTGGPSPAPAAPLPPSTESAQQLPEYGSQENQAGHTHTEDQVTQNTYHVIHNLAHWVSHHETLTGMGFGAVGVIGVYGAQQLLAGAGLGGWTLSANAHSTIIYASGLGVVNWFSPQIYAQLSQHSHYVFFAFFGYKIGTRFAARLKKNLAPPGYEEGQARPPRYGRNLPGRRMPTGGRPPQNQN